MHGGPNYTREIEPMIGAMEKTFAARGATELTNALRNVTAPVSSRTSSGDSGGSPPSRAKQGAWPSTTTSTATGPRTTPFSDAERRSGSERLETARAAPDDAAKIVTEREKHYCVPPARIGRWQRTDHPRVRLPLDGVHSLFYWWRDEGKAVDAAQPCYEEHDQPGGRRAGRGIPSWRRSASSARCSTTTAAWEHRGTSRTRALSPGSRVGPCSATFLRS